MQKRFKYIRNVIAEKAQTVEHYEPRHRNVEKDEPTQVFFYQVGICKLYRKYCIIFSIRYDRRFTLGMLMISQIFHRKNKYKNMDSLHSSSSSTSRHFILRACFRVSFIRWSQKFAMIKCRTTDISEFQNYEY